MSFCRPSSPRVHRLRRLLSLPPRTLLTSSLVALSFLALVLVSVPAALATPPSPFGAFPGSEGDTKLPSNLQWSPDGSTLAYTWNDGPGEALHLMDASTGKSRVLLRPGHTTTGNGALSAIDEFSWGPESTYLLLHAGGDLYLALTDSTKLVRLTETEAAEQDATVAPDGRHVAFVRDQNLYVLELESRRGKPAAGDERQLTHDGKANEILNAQTDWLYWEELWGRDSTGYWWSPNGKRIVFYRFDERPVPTYPLVNYLPTYPEVEAQRYPKAGQDNPLVKMGVVEVPSGSVAWLDSGDPLDTYLARVTWTVDSEELAVQTLNRDQNRLDMLRCTAADGQCKTWFTESAKTWVNPSDEAQFLADGRFLWSSELRGPDGQVETEAPADLDDRATWGWRQLYLFEADGSGPRRLTDLDGHITGIDAVIPSGQGGATVLFNAYHEGFFGAAGRRLLRLSLADGSVEPMALSTTEAGWHSATTASNGNWVHGYQNADETPRPLVLHTAEGDRVGELPFTPGTGIDTMTLPQWRYVTVPGPDGVGLPARLLEPLQREAGKKYPAIQYHYGGPEAQSITDRWDGRRRDLWHKWMATRGYVVLQVDNRVSNFFGKKGGDRVHRRFGPNNLEAILAGVEYLKTLGYVDTDHIGLWGWSGGGFHTLHALLHRPGIWAAGVAGAPVTDWYLYDSIWTERYLDHPESNKEGYRLSSPLTFARQLEDPLLLVHGTADDNVHPQNSIAFSHPLVEAGIPFEQAFYPRQKHGFQAPAFKHFLERIAEFFDRHLMAD